MSDSFRNGEIPGMILVTGSQYSVKKKQKQLPCGSHKLASFNWNLQWWLNQKNKLTKETYKQTNVTCRGSRKDIWL